MRRAHPRPWLEDLLRALANTPSPTHRKER